MTIVLHTICTAQLAYWISTSKINNYHASHQTAMMYIADLHEIGPLIYMYLHPESV